MYKEEYNDMINTISPEHVNYIIGFLQGDGSITEQSRNRGKIIVEISDKDFDILDKIEIDLCQIAYIGRGIRTRNTNFKDNYNSCKLSIYDLFLRQHLSKYIPIGKKAFTIKPPTEFEDFQIYPYIRGLSDADGSLGITSENRAFWSICTSSDYIKNFVVKDVKKVLNIEKRINRNKRDGVYNIVLYDEDAVFYTRLLYDRSTIYLNRKYVKFLEVQAWKRSIPKRKGTKKIWLSYEDDLLLNSQMSLKNLCLLLDRSQNSIKTRLWRLKQK